MKLTQCELVLYKVSGEAQNYYKVQCERYKSIKNMRLYYMIKILM